MDKMGKLHNMPTFIPVHRGNMSEEEEQHTVESLMFLKQKCDQTIQGCMVGDGRKQLETAVKGLAASPTVCIESIFIMAAIAMHTKDRM